MRLSGVISMAFRSLQTTECFLIQSGIVTVSKRVLSARVYVCVCGSMRHFYVISSNRNSSVSLTIPTFPRSFHKLTLSALKQTEKVLTPHSIEAVRFAISSYIFVFAAISKIKLTENCINLNFREYFCLSLFYLIVFNFLYIVSRAVLNLFINMAFVLRT